jgi:hypothetical protein
MIVAAVIIIVAIFGVLITSLIILRTPLSNIDENGFIDKTDSKE